MMYNPMRKRDEKIRELEDRLVRHAELIAEDHAVIAMLKSDNRCLKAVFDTLRDEFAAIKARQDRLREGLFNALTHEDTKDD